MNTGLLGAGVVILAIAVSAIVIRQHTRDLDTASSEARTLVAAARRRALSAVIAAGVLAIGAITAVAWLAPELQGLSLTLTPGVAGATALLVYAAAPPTVIPVADGSPRQASLVPRTLRSLRPRAIVAAPLTLSLIIVVTLLTTGLTATQDSLRYSSSVSFETAEMSSTASPYPGWPYAVPLLLTVAALIIAALIAFRRITATPALPSGTQATLDAAWRRRSAAIVSAITSSALLFILGGVWFYAGSAVASAASGMPVYLGWEIAGRIIQVSGGLAVLGCIASFALAVSWATTLSSRVLTSTMSVRA